MAAVSSMSKKHVLFLRSTEHPCGREREMYRLCQKFNIDYETWSNSVDGSLAEWFSLRRTEYSYCFVSFIQYMRYKKLLSLVLPKAIYLIDTAGLFAGYPYFPAELEPYLSVLFERTRTKQLLLTATTEEQQVLEQFRSIRAQSMYFKTPLQVPERLPVSGKELNLLVVGDFAQEQEASALQFLSRHVLPVCIEAGLAVTIAGSNIPARFFNRLSVQCLTCKQGRFPDEVCDQRSVLLAAAQGIRVQKDELFEAMAQAVPIITTEFLRNTLDSTLRTSVILAHQPDSWIEQIDRLYKSEHAWQEQSVELQRVATPERQQAFKEWNDNIFQQALSVSL